MAANRSESRSPHFALAILCLVALVVTLIGTAATSRALDRRTDRVRTQSGPVLIATQQVFSSLAEADAAVFDAAVDRARAQVVVEQSRAHQDYTVSGGTRFLRETNDVAVLGGISIPLGRFDRNQGNIARAQAERRQLEFQSEASRLERLRRLASLRADADAARVRAEGIMNDVYPKDEEGPKSVADVADIMVPHLGASTREANAKAAELAALELLDLDEKGIDKAVVNKAK